MIPKGMVLKCLTSERLNTDPSNWKLIPRALLPRLNGGVRKTSISYESASDELKPAILAVAELEHGARLARKRGQG